MKADKVVMISIAVLFGFLLIFSCGIIVYAGIAKIHDIICQKEEYLNELCCKVVEWFF